MTNIHKIPTQPSLFRRIARHEAGFACLLLLALFGFIAVGEVICTLLGVGAK